MKISELAELMVATETLLTEIASVIIAIKKRAKRTQATQSSSSKALVGWGESPLDLPRLYHIGQKNEIFTNFHIRIFYISNNYKRQIKVKVSG